MDVSCPRCKTEYEFDDARVPDAGVTVKCTTCNHVFRVKRVASATPDASGPQEVEFSEATLPPPTPKEPREWKVRSANGKITTFTELSELQRHIVESKVSREDEVSLTGDSWKRLGHITEFTTFFNLVDQAKKAEGVRPAETVSPILSNIESSLSDGSKSVVAKPVDLAPAASPTAAPVPAMQQPGPSLSPPSMLPPPPPPRSGNRGVSLGLALAFVAFAGLAYYYFMMMRPAAEQAQQHKEPTPVEVQTVKKAETPPTPDASVEEPPVEEVKAPEKVEQKVDEKSAEAPPAPEPEAEKAEKIDVQKPKERATVERSTAKKREPSDSSDTGGSGGSSEKTWKRGADFWIARADRLRDKEKPQSALDAYGKALDLAPDNVEALTGKGLCYLDMGKPAHAEPLLEQAMKVNPKYAPALMGIAESYRLQSKKDAAIKAYQRYLDVFPNGPEASVAKANIQRLK